MLKHNSHILFIISDILKNRLKTNLFLLLKINIFSFVISFFLFLFLFLINFEIFNNKITAQTLDNSSLHQRYGHKEALNRIRVFSNKAGNITTENGSMYKLRPYGTYVFLKHGWNEVTVSGKNVLRQKYRINISSKDLFQSLFIALKEFDENKIQKSQNKSDNNFDQIHQSFNRINHFPYTDYLRKPRSMRSICHKVYYSSPLTQRSNIDYCIYRDLEEEIFYTGPLFSPFNPKETFNLSDIDEFYKLIWHFRYSQRISVLGEQIYRTSKFGTIGFETAAFAALLEGRCDRVVDISNDMYSIDIQSISVMTYLAICYEQAAQDDLAVKYLKASLANHPKSDPLAAAATYHLARIIYKKSANDAKNLFNRCTEQFPWYQPCIIALANINLQIGKLLTYENLISDYSRSMTQRIYPTVKNIIKELSENRLEQAKNLIENHSHQHISYSLTFLKNYIALLEKDKSTLRTRSIYFSHALDQKSANLILPLIKNELNSHLYLSSLKIQFRDLIMMRSQLLNSISHFYFSQDKCSYLLFFRSPKTKIKQIKKHPLIYEKILDRFASCMITLNQIDKAEEYLLNMQRLLPYSWLPRYRIGLLYEQKGNLFLAVNYLKQSLNFTENKDNIGKILNKINILEAKISKDMNEQEEDY